MCICENGTSWKGPSPKDEESRSLIIRQLIYKAEGIEGEEYLIWTICANHVAGTRKLR